MSDLKQQLEAIADGAPPPIGMRRDGEIARAIDAGLAAPEARARRVWPWALVAATAAATVAIFLVVRSPAAAIVVERGAIGAPTLGRPIDVPADGVVLRTPDDSTIEASALARFSLADRAATRWRLERGRLTSHVTKRAPGQTFEIATPEATVTVVGTRFIVERAGATTTVIVEEGVVRVTAAGGDITTLHAGERWPAAMQTAAIDPGASGSGGTGTTGSGFGSGTGMGTTGSGSAEASPSTTTTQTTPTTPQTTTTTTTKATPMTPTAPQTTTTTTTTTTPTTTTTTPPTTTPPPTTTAPPTTTPTPSTDVATIRKTIHAGKLADARKLIDDRRKVARSAPDLAELGILTAEAELAARQIKRAIELYLAVLRDYPSTPQAEQALFAAAQLAFDRPDAGYKPDLLLRDYLDAYPHGQFAGDAKRLLDRAKN